MCPPTPVVKGARGVYAFVRTINEDKHVYLYTPAPEPDAAAPDADSPPQADSLRYVVIKRAPKDEADTHRIVTARFPSSALVPSTVVRLLDEAPVDAWPGDTRVWLVMEHARGGSLAELLEHARAAAPREGIPLRLAYHVLFEAAAALATLHTRCGVVHEDLHAGNVLFDDDDAGEGPPGVAAPLPGRRRWWWPPRVRVIDFDWASRVPGEGAREWARGGTRTAAPGVLARALLSGPAGAAGLLGEEVLGLLRPLAEEESVSLDEMNAFVTELSSRLARQGGAWGEPPEWLFEYFEGKSA